MFDLNSSHASVSGTRARPDISAPPARDTAVDLLRGLAIAFMVMANMSELLKEPHPYWYRLSSSFVAPLFILLAGMMVDYTARHRGGTAGHYFKRGAMLMVVAILNDVVNFHIWPMLSCDVLYLIALGIPSSYLLGRAPSWFRWIAIVSIFAATPFLQKVLGYTDYPTEIYFSSEKSVAAANPSSPLNHWLVDGWFPIFPWLGFALLGVQFGEMRRNYRSRRGYSTWAFLLGAVIAALGAYLWKLHPGAQIIRDVYGELYYPPTIGFVVTTIGVLILLFQFAEPISHWALWKPVEVLGGASLAVYLLHLAIITYILAPRWPGRDFPIFLVIYFTTMVVLTLAAYGLKALKARWKNMPEAVKMVVGA